jgi:hypothetical protein
MHRGAAVQYMAPTDPAIGHAHLNGAAWCLSEQCNTLVQFNGVMRSMASPARGSCTDTLLLFSNPARSHPTPCSSHPARRSLVPLDKVDLRLVQLAYTSGNLAAIRPDAPAPGLALAAEVAGLTDSVWREVMQRLALPGALLATALILTVPETRNPPRLLAPFVAPPPPPPQASPKGPAMAVAATAVAVPAAGLDISSLGSAGLPAPPANVGAGAGAPTEGGGLDGLKDVMGGLLRNRPLIMSTAAAALNDMAGDALIAWQVWGL